MEGAGTVLPSTSSRVDWLYVRKFGRGGFVPPLRLQLSFPGQAKGCINRWPGGGGEPLAAFRRVFVIHVHSHHHPVWLATRVLVVDARVTAANRALVSVLFGEEVVKKNMMHGREYFT